MKNKFCNKDSLNNESDVEQFFVIKLLEDLDYTDDYIKTKKNILVFKTYGFIIQLLPQYKKELRLCLLS